MPNTVSQSYTTHFSAAIPPLAITSAAPDAGTVGVPYSFTFTATGGVPPYTWSVTAGALESGLSLDPTSGILSGTPTAAGDATYTITVTDSAP